MAQMVESTWARVVASGTCHHEIQDAMIDCRFGAPWVAIGIYNRKRNQIRSPTSTFLDFPGSGHALRFRTQTRCRPSSPPNSQHTRLYPFSHGSRCAGPLQEGLPNPCTSIARSVKRHKPNRKSLARRRFREPWLHLSRALHLPVFA